MFVAIVLVVIVGLWFQHGWILAASFLASSSAASWLWYRSPPLIPMCLGLLILIGLEWQHTHPLKSQFKHLTFPLTVCLQQPVQQYSDDYQSVIGRVVYQPDSLTLRHVKIAVYDHRITSQWLPGDCIKGQFRLRQPLGRLVPGAFNSDKYFFSQHVDALATLVAIEEITVRSTFAQRAYRSRMNEFQTDRALQVWAALVLGWSSAMDPDLKQTLSANQLMHLFVISGMHIGFISLFVYGIAHGIGWILRPYCVLGFKGKALLTLAATLAYVGFLDFPIPATRALIMAGVPLVLFVFAARLSWYSSLMMAATTLTLVRPESWLALGTWLSFTSVLLIQLILRWRALESRNWFFKVLLFQSIMSLSVLPWAVLYGFPVNPLSVVLNLLFTPILAFVLLPIALLILLMPSPYAVQLFEWLLSVLIPFLEASASHSFALQWREVLPVLTILVLIFLVVWYRQGLLIFIVVAVSMGLFGMGVLSSHQTIDEASVTVFDVGHGQAILLALNEEKWLYDSAGMLSDELSVAERYLARALPELTGIIISHSDMDHSGGYNYIQSRFPGLRAFSGQPGKIPHSINCHNADSPSVFMTFVPVPMGIRNSDNNHSCIVLIEHSGRKVLLTGDADKYVEYYLLQHYPEIFPVDVLVLGHHGSDSSSAADWLNRNKGALYLVSNGDRARPVWPSARLVDWFSGNSEQLTSTARQGTIKILISSTGVRVKTFEPAYRNRLIN